MKESVPVWQREVDGPVAHADAPPNGTKILGLITKSFPVAEDEDGMTWFANTDGRFTLCYRAGLA